MRNRDLIQLKLENLEGKFKALRYLVSNAQDVKEFLNVIENSEELLEEVKSLINIEDLSPNEMNKTN